MLAARNTLLHSVFLAGRPDIHLLLEFQFSYMYIPACQVLVPNVTACISQEMHGQLWSVAVYEVSPISHFELCWGEGEGLRLTSDVKLWIPLSRMLAVLQLGYISSVVLEFAVTPCIQTQVGKGHGLRPPNQWLLPSMTAINVRV